MKQQGFATHFTPGTTSQANLKERSNGLATERRLCPTRIGLLSLLLPVLMYVHGAAQVGPKRKVENQPARNRTGVARSAKIQQARRSNGARAVARNTPSPAIRNNSGGGSVATDVPFAPHKNGDLSEVGGGRPKVFVHDMRAGNVEAKVPIEVASQPGLLPRNKIIEELGKYPGVQIVNSAREADVEIFYDFSSRSFMTPGLHLNGYFTNDKPPRWVPPIDRPDRQSAAYYGTMSVVKSRSNPPRIIWQKSANTGDSNNPFPATKMTHQLIKDLQKLRGAH